MGVSYKNKGPQQKGISVEMTVQEVAGITCPNLELQTGNLINVLFVSFPQHLFWPSVSASFMALARIGCDSERSFCTRDSMCDAISTA